MVYDVQTQNAWMLVYFILVLSFALPFAFKSSHRIRLLIGQFCELHSQRSDVINACKMSGERKSLQQIFSERYTCILQAFVHMAAHVRVRVQKSADVVRVVRCFERAT